MRSVNKTDHWNSSHTNYNDMNNISSICRLWTNCEKCWTMRTTEQCNVSPSGICTLQLPVIMVTCWKKISKELELYKHFNEEKHRFISIINHSEQWSTVGPQGESTCIQIQHLREATTDRRGRDSWVSDGPTEWFLRERGKRLDRKGEEGRDTLSLQFITNIQFVVLLSAGHWHWDWPPKR